MGMFGLEWLGMAAAAALALRVRQKGPALCLIQGQGEDGDVKIAGSSWSSRPREEGNAVADAYLTQRRLGNIERARALGERFAQLLEEEGQRLSPAIDPRRPEECQPALYSLLAFAVNRAVERFSPNSILAHIVLSAFYDTLAGCCPECSEAAGDSAAFSLYLLAIRGRQPEEEAAGRVFARLCGREDNEAAVKQAAKLYGTFLSRLEALTRQAGYLSA